MESREIYLFQTCYLSQKYVLLIELPFFRILKCI